MLALMGMLGLTPVDAGAAIAAPPPAQGTPANQWGRDFQPLLLALKQQGFRLRLEPPPRRGVYGLFEASTRTLWIAPISQELGIARQTLLHEAVHAAQSCPTGVLRPVGWSLPLTPLIEREISGILIRGYQHHNRALELEAFALQGQPNAVALLVQALQQRCRR
jgi:hypothetical protein